MAGTLSTSASNVHSGKTREMLETDNFPQHRYLSTQLFRRALVYLIVAQSAHLVSQRYACRNAFHI